MITDQAGVARGFYSETHVDELTQWIKAELCRDGAHLDDLRMSRTVRTVSSSTTARYIPGASRDRA